MEVTQLGIVTLVKLSQPQKAPSPIKVTQLGIVTLVKLSHQEKAQFPIEVMSSEITIFPVADGYAIKVVASLLRRFLQSVDDE